MLPDINSPGSEHEQEDYGDDFEAMGPSRESSPGGDMFNNQFSNVMINNQFESFTVPPIVSPNKQSSYKHERRRIRGLQTRMFPMMAMGSPKHELYRFLKIRGEKDPREIASIVQGAIQRYDAQHPQVPYDPKRSRDEVDVDVIINKAEPRHAKNPTETSVSCSPVRLSQTVLGKMEQVRAARQHYPAKKRPAPPVQKRRPKAQPSTPLETKLDRAEAARARALAKLQSAQARRDNLAEALAAREEQQQAKEQATAAAEKEQERADAIVQLQSTYRGHRGREKAKARRQDVTYKDLGGSPHRGKEMGHEEAAILIQSRARGMLARDQVETDSMSTLDPGMNFSIRGMDFEDNTRRFKPRRRKRVAAAPGDQEQERMLNRYVDAPEDLEGDIFRILDSDNDGLISCKDLQTFLESTEADTGSLDYQAMIEEASVSGVDERGITLKEFAQYLRLMQRKEKEEKKRAVEELDGKTRRFLLIARLQGKLAKPIELDPRFIKQKVKKQA